MKTERLKKIIEDAYQAGYDNKDIWTHAPEVLKEEYVKKILKSLPLESDDLTRAHNIFYPKNEQISKKPLTNNFKPIG